MSALRQLLAWLWAAVWVRWRLAAVRARALVGGGGTPAAAGSSYYLSAGEIPVEGVDYEPVDLPPELAARLDANRAELVEHARSTTARRTRGRRARRRRTASLSMAALVTLAVLGAGATALVTGSTGVPAVDRLLGIYEAGLDKPGASGRRGPMGRDLRPDSSVASVSIEIAVDGRVRRIVSTSYVAEDAGVCSALAGVDGGRSGDLVCLPPLRLVRRLNQHGGVLLVTEGPSEIVLRGFVNGDVVQLEGTGPAGRLKTSLGDSWTTDLPGIPSLRPFVAIGERVRGRSVTGHDYVVKTVSADGSRRQVTP